MNPAVRAHALQVVELCTTDITEVRLSLSAAEEVAPKSIVLGKRLSTTCTTEKLDVRMNYGMLFNVRQPIGAKFAQRMDAKESVPFAVHADKVTLVKYRVGEFRWAITTTVKLGCVTALVTGKLTSSSKLLITQ